MGGGDKTKSFSLVAEKKYRVSDEIIFKLDYVKDEYIKIWVGEELKEIDISPTAEIEENRGLILEYPTRIGSTFPASSAMVIRDYFVETSKGTLIDGRPLTTGLIMCYRDEFGRIISEGELEPETLDFRTAFTRRGKYRYRMFNPIKNLPPRYTPEDCDFDCEVLTIDDKFQKIIATDVRSNAIWELSQVNGKWRDWVAAGEMSTEMFQIDNQQEVVIDSFVIHDVNQDLSYRVGDKLFTALPAGRAYRIELQTMGTTISGLQFIASGGNTRTLVIKDYSDTENGLFYECSNDVVGSAIVRIIKNEKEVNRRLDDLEKPNPIQMFADDARIIYENATFKFQKKYGENWTTVSEVK